MVKTDNVENESSVDSSPNMKGNQSESSVLGEIENEHDEMIDVVGDVSGANLTSSESSMTTVESKVKGVKLEAGTSRLTLEKCHKVNSRSNFFKYKHKQARNDLKIMEQHAVHVIELASKAMDGYMEHTPELFRHYKAAIEAYQKAVIDIRIALLTERKLASEIWGPNNIAIYNKETGEHTILDQIIEQLLQAEYPAAYEDKRTEKKKEETTTGRKRKPPQTLEDNWSGLSDDDVPISQVKVEGILPETRKKRKSNNIKKRISLLALPKDPEDDD